MERKKDCDLLLREEKTVWQVEGGFQSFGKKHDNGKKNLNNCDIITFI